MKFMGVQGRAIDEMWHWHTSKWIAEVVPMPQGWYAHFKTKRYRIELFKSYNTANGAAVALERVVKQLGWRAR